MLDYKFTLPICIFILIGSVLRFFRAEKYLYLNEELFIHTPEHDVENVKKKHRKIWLCLFAFSFFPLVLIAIDVLFALLATESVYEIYNTAMTVPIIIMLISVWVLSVDKYGDISRELKAHGKTIGRYIVYPRPGLLVVQMSALLITVVATIGSVIFCSLGIEVEIPKGYGTVFLFAELLGLTYLANYAIIRYFHNTPRELVLGDVPESEYDRAAKRYYGIWRNRLIAANVVAGAQLILGGFVTLTNAGEHLMGIRILGLVILVAVFTCILIQSREFEDPVVVGGMVYPSERKRVLMQKIILSAIVLYILGAVILL